MDTPPLVDQLYRILPPGQHEDKLVPLYAPLVMTDGNQGFVLMIGAILWLGVLFSMQIIRKEREFTFTKLACVPIFLYFVGALMLTKELGMTGLLQHLMYGTGMVASGYLFTLGTAFILSPLLRGSMYLCDFAIAVKEEAILLLVRDYGLPENAKELVLLFAKEHTLRPYLFLKRLGMRTRAYASYFILTITDKVKEARKMVA